MSRHWRRTCPYRPVNLFPGIYFRATAYGILNHNGVERSAWDLENYSVPGSTSVSVILAPPQAAA